MRHDGRSTARRLWPTSTRSLATAAGHGRRVEARQAFLRPRVVRRQSLRGHADGEVLTSEHSETDEAGTSHEELFYVARGRATFLVEGEEVDAPAGTFVYVRDPDVRRGAVAREPGTVVFVAGGAPGEAYEVSLWSVTSSVLRLCEASRERSST